MPYDGRPVDMVFNPLGAPSQMNIGQIFEMLAQAKWHSITSQFMLGTLAHHVDRE